MAVIAELKRRSPSKGSLNDTLDAAARAAAYAGAGARALSVLTEPEEFGGSGDDLVEARRATNIAVLKKDFHVAPVQVWEARALGASALLLIARALGAAGVEAMLAEARAAGLEALVEVRSEAELDWAVTSGAQLIGVNCRDLETLRVEPEVHDRVLPLIPADRVAVAESGVRDRTDVLRLAALGADAVLVGSALSIAGDATMAVRALTGVARQERRRGPDA